MILIPYPHKLTESSGVFRMSELTQIFLDIGCDYSDFEAALSLRNEIEKASGLKLAITKGRCGKDKEKTIFADGSITLMKTGLKAAGTADVTALSAYTLTVGTGSIIIKGNGSSSLYYGIQTLKQLVRNYACEIPCMDIEDQPTFEARGFYHDVTRGKVPTLDTLKDLADRLSFYKINQLQLYFEHSFAFKKYSEIWTDSDPITAEEILVLDEYCRKRGIELVPSLSVFGHLYHVLLSGTFRHLNEYEVLPDKPFLWTDRMVHYTLDASDPESLAFAKELTDEFIPLFTSDKFNICCDETFDLGLGKNRALLDEIGRGKLYLFFVKSLIDHLKSRKKKVMMWGDTLLKYPQLLGEIPDNVTILNWNYDPEASEDGFRQISEAGLKQYVCPGVQGWNRLINDMDNASKNIRSLTDYAVKYSALGILNTDWGDFGHINLLAGSIPGAIYGAALSWNAGRPDHPTDEEISILEYGDKTGSLAGLIRQLSRQPIIEWNTIVLWYYTMCGYDTGIYGKFYTHARELMLNHDECKIRAAYDRIKEIEASISLLHQSVFDDRKQDVSEFLVAADGLALFQALLLVIKKKFLGQSSTGLIFSPDELAVKLEYWFSRYKSAWRARNKESELFRIKDVLMGICRLLRER
ncbi:MAG: family 20 glycosylhydrolase [Clostridiaceae bacterium]|nr:family 20 glycosylhydrolase [Clostridiaceae bacterium]